MTVDGSPLAAAVADGDVLHDVAAASEFTLYRSTGGSPRGLTETDAAERLARGGENLGRVEPAPTWSRTLWTSLRSPFVALLGSLGVVLTFLGDARGAIPVALVVVAAVTLRAWQHGRAARAVSALCTAEPATATVRRRSTEAAAPTIRETPVSEVVIGDVVLLRAGDVVPADLRITASTGLTIDQSMLTGRALPVGKTARRTDGDQPPAVVDDPRLCFAGTIVVAGGATGVVVGTGAHTYSVSLRRNADRLARRSSADRGVRSVGWTLVRFMMVMAPLVFVVRGVADGQWTHAAILAVTVAVGLTPEMLPVVVTTALVRGATRLAARHLIVRRLDAIQDLGGMAVLCVDKTGTLTEDRVVYAHSVDATGQPDDLPAELAFIATELGDVTRGRFADAVALVAKRLTVAPHPDRRLVDEVPFTHRRRRASVVVTRRGGHRIICQGDADTVLPRCVSMRTAGGATSIDDLGPTTISELVDGYRQAGMQVIAIAVRDLPARLGPYTADDETGCTLAGFVVFVDPVRSTSAAMVDGLTGLGVTLKMVTGDARTVALHAAAQLGLAIDTVLTGDAVDGLDGDALRVAVAAATIVAEATPAQKARVVAALQTGGTCVGFVGDGVNDVAALRLADVGIATDTSGHAAKDAADLIMLNGDLRVLAEGVVEGRRTLGNTMKYVRITASSNVGNALSVLIAGLLLPVLPILPLQLLVQNLLYDCAQLALPWDRVDPAYLGAPRRWRSDGLIRFMVTFGALSSVVDVATFGALWWWFGGAGSAAVFQTGWFLEGLLSQLLIVMVLRSTAAPWRSPRPATAMVVAAALAAAIGGWLPVGPLDRLLHLQPPPWSYGLWLAAAVTVYALAAHAIRSRFFRRIDEAAAARRPSAPARRRARRRRPAVPPR